MWVSVGETRAKGEKEKSGKGENIKGHIWERQNKKKDRLRKVEKSGRLKEGRGTKMQRDVWRRWTDRQTMAMGRDKTKGEQGSKKEEGEEEEEAAEEKIVCWQGL